MRWLQFTFKIAVCLGVIAIAYCCLGHSLSNLILYEVGLIIGYVAYFWLMILGIYMLIGALLLRQSYSS